MSFEYITPEMQAEFLEHTFNSDDYQIIGPTYCDGRVFVDVLSNDGYGFTLQLVQSWEVPSDRH